MCLRWGRLFSLSLGVLGLTGCSSPQSPSSSVRTLAPYRATSKPYKIKGIWYYPQQHYEFEDVGIASWYGERDGTHGRFQATGVRYDMFKDTAAHKTLPIPCIARITNLENGRSLVVKISDRGPFKYERVLDLSVSAAQKLGFYRQGTTLVKIQTLVAESVALPENQKAYARAKRSGRKTPVLCAPPRSLPTQRSPNPNPKPPYTLPKANPVRQGKSPPQRGGLDTLLHRPSSPAIPSPRPSSSLDGLLGS